jgi:hypothetical protein
MSHQLVTASILLCFLAVAASGQQQLKGGHVGAIATSPESAISHSLASVEGSESVSSITLQEGLNGYYIEAYYSDSTCTSFVSGILYPLNTCFSQYSIYTGYWFNVKMMATSSTEMLQEFNDDQCAVMASSSAGRTFSPFQTTCTSGVKLGDTSKLFVQSSKEAPTTQSVIYVR